LFKYPRKNVEFNEGDKEFIDKLNIFNATKLSMSVKEFSPLTKKSFLEKFNKLKELTISFDNKHSEQEQLEILLPPNFYSLTKIVLENCVVKLSKNFAKLRTIEITLTEFYKGESDFILNKPFSLLRCDKIILSRRDKIYPTKTLLFKKNNWKINENCQKDFISRLMIKGKILQYNINLDKTSFNKFFYANK